MVSIILASHGEMARGILMSAEMIVGRQNDVLSCCLMPSEGPEEYKSKILNTIDSFNDNNEILFLVDLWGGTPFNQISAIIKDHTSWGLIAGMNLPIVLECLLSRQNHNSAHDLLKHVIKTTEKSIASLPEIKEENSTTNYNKSVLKRGHIDYVLARVDSRLLHGQIATGWCKVLEPNRIIVVSDKIAHDDLRKNLIKRASPADIKAHIVPIKKLAEIDKDERFGGTRALLLFENLEDALSCIKAGVKIKTINLGSIAHKEDKVNVTEALSMSQNDIDIIEEMKSLSIEIDVRKVPSDNPENIDKILNKAKSLLKGE